MPRVNGIMQPLPNTYGQPGRPIESAKYNTQLDDLVSDANAARPITAGGTGAVSVADAKLNFGLDKVTNRSEAEMAATGAIRAVIEQRAQEFADDRASRRVAKGGDTMTGDLGITKAYPSVALHYPGVKNGHWLLTEAGVMAWRDVQSGQVHFYIGSSGQVWTQELGDLNSRIENRAAAYAQNGINAANDRFSQLRLTGFGSTGGNLDFTSIGGGMVITGYRRAGGGAGDVFNLYYAQLQGFSPSRGWVAAYND